MSEQKQKIKKPFYKRWWFIALVALFLIGIISGGEEDNNQVDTSNSNQESIEVKNEEKEQPDMTNFEVKNEEEQPDMINFEAKMNLEVEEKKIIVTIDTNVPDGGLFEVLLMNGKLESVSDFIPVENGKAVKIFDVSKWDVGYITGTAMFRFDLKEHPQPQNIIEIYGENGQKLKGSKVIEGHDGYMFGQIEPVTIAYPDKQTVINKQQELLLAALNEMIKASNGVILKIQPHFKDGDWSSVAVTVSDSWYYSQDYEKERFAEQVGAAIQNVIKTSGLVDKNDFISVYFYDTYQKELASPKLLGGYKIKR